MKRSKRLLKITGLLVASSVTVLACSKSEDGYRKGDTIDEALKPTAGITANETSVEAGSTVLFTDGSTNTPYLWTWDLPGATPNRSNEQNPVVVYEFAGVYPVKLKVRNDFGADEIFIDGYITVTAPPAVDVDVQAQVRYTFDGNQLNSDLDKGLRDIPAITDGAQQFGIRPGGGDAYVLNGSNALTIPGYTGINGNGARSVALWVKTSSTSVSGIVHWGAAGALSRSSLKMQGSGVIRFEYQGGGSNGSTSINDDQWHHVAYTYDGNTLKLYVDGVEDFTASNINIDTGNAGETDVNIGSQLGGSIFTGMVDDVRIYDLVLTPEEVAILSQMQ